MARVFGSYIFRTFKIVYRRYAGLYFCLCVDINDNNLGYMEAIHNFVEASLCAQCPLVAESVYCCRLSLCADCCWQFARHSCALYSHIARARRY